MASHFTMFSFSLEDLTDDELAWCQRFEEYLEGVETGEIEPTEDDEFSSVLPDHGETPDYRAEVDAEERSVWLHADESGTPEHVVLYVQAFLKKFRPADFIGFEWANLCSRPLLDAFGGGAVLVTAQSAHYHSSSQWLSERVKELEATLAAEREFDRLIARIEHIGVDGVDGEGEPGMFAIEFESSQIGAPHLTGTGWLPDRETAEAVAAFILPMIDLIAEAMGEEVPEDERAYCYIVSAERGDDEEPAVFEQYHGDVFLVASAELNMLDDDQRRRLDKARPFLQKET